VRRRRLIAVLLLITYLPACHSWRAEEAAPQAVMESRPPQNIRAVRVDGTKQVLHHAQLRSDTLWGVMPEPPIALQDVQAVETRHGSLGKSLLLGGGIVTGTLLILVAACAADPGCLPRD
jgi:hypothetical protein